MDDLTLGGLADTAAADIISEKEKRSQAYGSVHLNAK